MPLKIYKSILSLHVMLAGLVFVPAFMFAITGSLYTYKVSGSQTSSNWNVTAQIQNPNSLVEFVTLAEQQLKEKNLSLPTGSSSLKKMGTSWSFEWTGTDKDFLLEPTADAGIFKATLKEASWYRYFVQLHKAKGGALFKLISVTLGASLILLFVSGVLIAWRNSELKAKFFATFAFGTALFALFAYMS